MPWAARAPLAPPAGCRCRGRCWRRRAKGIDRRGDAEEQTIGSGEGQTVAALMHVEEMAVGRRVPPLPIHTAGGYRESSLQHDQAPATVLLPGVVASLRTPDPPKLPGFTAGVGVQNMAARRHRRIQQRNGEHNNIAIGCDAAPQSSTQTVWIGRSSGHWRQSPGADAEIGRPMAARSLLQLEATPSGSSASVLQISALLTT